MKTEQRPKKVLRFMTAQREIYYALRNANATVDRADEELNFENTTEA